MSSCSRLRCTSSTASLPSGDPDAIFRGTLRRFSIAKGWGLIRPDGDADEIVVRASEIVGADGSTIAPGQPAEFRVSLGAAGIEATAVRLLDDIARPGLSGQPLGPADPSRIGNYLLRSRLGDGGMGRVYLAEDGHGRRVAVKVIRPDRASEQEFIRRFALEVALAQQVDSPHVARVIEGDSRAEPPYLVTE